MTKRKVLTRIAIGLLIFLVICTVLSRSIYLAMLPQVSVTELRYGRVTSDMTYIGAFDYTDKQIVTAGAAWTLTEVNVKTGISVEKGDILAKVDMTDAELTRRQLMINVSNAETVLKNARGDAAKEQAQLNLDVALRALEKFEASYPKDGVIVAETDGKVLSCSYVTGDQVAAGAVVMELRTADSAPVISWEVGGSEADLLDLHSTVTLSFAAIKQGSETSFNINGSVSGKTTDAASGISTFTVKLTSFEYEIPSGSIPVITYTEVNAMGTFVPLSALTDLGGDSYIMYVLDTKQGIFGEEHIVKQVEVQKLGDNNVKAVINGDFEEDASIVTHSSKTLKDGMSVALE